MMQWIYIDPGSGSYFAQVIIAAILGVIFYFKTAWLWIKSLFIKTPKKEENDQQHFDE